MIYVVATLTIKPGSLEALRAPAAACIAETLKEEGCIAYELFESLSDPQKLIFVEKWETREHLTAHSKQPHLAVWREASGPHLVSRAIEIVHPEKVETF
jgi:quinol monooxygenase YgiN